MNEDLLKVRDWCFGNRLLLNPDKTKLIVFGSRQMTSKLHEFHLSLLGKDISPVQSARDLGVILDPYLTFENHITTSVSECIARLAQINRVKHCLDKNTLLTVIHALVFSKMYYCSNVWANTTSKNVRKLQAVQNFACRIVSGAKKYDHVTPLLKSLSWLPLKDQLYYRLQAIMAFKCMTGHAPEYLTSQFITREQVSERTTRSSQKLNIPLFRTASKQRAFYYRTVKLWNNLESFLKKKENARKQTSQCNVRRLQLLVPYNRFIDEMKRRENDWRTDNLTNNKRLFNCDNRRIETHQLHYESS